MIVSTLGRHLGGLTRPRLREHADLTSAECTRGLDWIRDNYDDLVVKLRIGGEWIYTIAGSNDEVVEDTRHRLKGWIRAMKRNHATLVKAARDFPSRANNDRVETARRAVYDLERAMEDLEA